MTIYMDISHFLRAQTITGIQRVVWEYIHHLMGMPQYDVVFLSWDFRRNRYLIVTPQIVRDKMENFHDIKDANPLSGEQWMMQDIDETGVFLEVDALWNGKCLRRGFLYSELKKHGMKIVVFLQDVVPVMYPQYVHPSTVYRFYDYLAACLKYADVILTSTEHTKKDIETIAMRCSLEKKVRVAGLGADVTAMLPTLKEDLREDVTTAVASGRYMLIVATIEPRKNHGVLLDCMEKELEGKNINLVIAGRQGWKCDELMERIRTHELLGKRIFLIEAADDKNITYLYDHAFLFVFPSFYEGYGLPIVEALHHGIPVLASDIEVFREIGADYCEYFPQNDPVALANLVCRYLEDETWYQKRKEYVGNYNPQSWRTSVENAIAAIDSLTFDDIEVPASIRQAYILSAREEDIIHALSGIEKYIPFIDRVLIGTPGAMIEKIKSMYRGKLIVDFLTDEEALHGEKLPADHEQRNFLLRCCAMKSEKLDSVFLMYDDDYRPLMEIKETDFLENGKYIGYYFYDLRYWCGKMMEPTSFDRGMYKTLSFLQKHAFPTLQYSAHMPQIIDRRIYREILSAYPNIEFQGYDEWSLYFNYACAKYPRRFLSRKFKTLCWPALSTDWYSMYMPEEYLFENYYPILYEKYNLQNMPQAVEEQDERSMQQKVLVKCREQFAAMHWRKTNAILESYDRWIRKDRTRPVSYMLVYDSKTGAMELYAPDRFFSRVNFCSRPSIRMVGFENLQEELWDLEMTYRFDPVGINGAHRMQTHPVAFGVKSASLPVVAPGKPGVYKLYIWCESRRMECKAVVGMTAWIYCE